MPHEKFDAFISYSRSASTQLASDLQVGVERFAKPWYRLRASRVFRDDSSMSANAALWATIEGGLREATWLILVATPEAAASEYVNNEIAWWIDHKDAANILLVYASGEISWDRRAGGFSAASDAIPPALLKAYAEEPRWIDLRWYEGAEGAGKSDPRFTERIADLASAVRNEERDKLVGENVRQHRRALTLLRAGVASLAGLLVISLVATVIAVVQGNEAASQRDAAQLQARIATARQLAATSQSLLSTDATTAKLLAVYAYQLHGDAQTQAALLAAVSTANGDTTLSIDLGEPVTAMGGANNGSVAILGTKSGRVLRWTPGTAPIELGKLAGSITAISTSADGTVVAASAQSHEARGVQLGGLWVDGKVVVLPQGAEPPVQVSPSGDTVAFAQALPDGYISLDFYGDTGFAFVRRVDGYTEPSIESIFTPGAVQFALPDDNRVIAWLGLQEFGQMQHRALDDFAIVNDVETGGGVPRDRPGQLAPEGDYLVQVDRNQLFDGATPTEIPIYSTDSNEKAPAYFGYAPTTALEAVAISSDLKRFATASAGRIYVSTPRSVDQPFEEPLVLEGSANISALYFLNANTLLSASGSSATIRLLDSGNPLLTDVPFTAAEASGAANGLPLVLTLNADGSLLATTEQGSWASSLIDAYGTSTWRRVGMNDPTTVSGVPLAWKSETEVYTISGDQLSVYNVVTDASSLLSLSAPFSVDGVAAPTGDVARYLASENRLYVAADIGVFEIDGTTGAVVESWPEHMNASLSLDARYAVTSAVDDSGVYISTVTELASGVQKQLAGAGVAAAKYRGPYLSQTPSRESVLLLSADGSTEVGTFAESFAGPLVVPDDGSLAARFTDDGLVSILSVLTGQVLGRFDIHGDSRGHVGVAFSANGLVLVGARTGYPQGTYSIIDLDPENWMGVLCTSAGRDLTDSEWLRFTGTVKPDGLGCG